QPGDPRLRQLARPYRQAGHQLRHRLPGRRHDREDRRGAGPRRGLRDRGALNRGAAQMRVAMFSAKRYERELLDELNGHEHELVYFDTMLGPDTASLAAGFPAVSVFVNDAVDGRVLKQLAADGTRLVTTRSTGFNHIDVKAAKQIGIKVARVTDYSPNSVAEFAVGLLLALNRRIPRAYNRTRDGNFELDGLMGFDLVGKTVAVIGTGKI